MVDIDRSLGTCRLLTRSNGCRAGARVTRALFEDRPPRGAGLELPGRRSLQPRNRDEKDDRSCCTVSQRLRCSLARPHDRHLAPASSIRFNGSRPSCVRARHGESDCVRASAGAAHELSKPDDSRRSCLIPVQILSNPVQSYSILFNPVQSCPILSRSCSIC